MVLQTRVAGLFFWGTRPEGQLRALHNKQQEYSDQAHVQQPTRPRNQLVSWFGANIAVNRPNLFAFPLGISDPIGRTGMGLYLEERAGCRDRADNTGRRQLRSRYEPSRTSALSRSTGFAPARRSRSPNTSRISAPRISVSHLQAMESTRTVRGSRSTSGRSQWLPEASSPRRAS